MFGMHHLIFIAFLKYRASWSTVVGDYLQATWQSRIMVLSKTEKRAEMNGILKLGSFEQYLKIGQLKKGFNKLEFKFLMIKIIKEAQ